MAAGEGHAAELNEERMEREGGWLPGIEFGFKLTELGLELTEVGFIEILIVDVIVVAVFELIF